MMEAIASAHELAAAHCDLSPTNAPPPRFKPWKPAPPPAARRWSKPVAAPPTAPAAALAAPLPFKPPKPPGPPPALAPAQPQDAVHAELAGLFDDDEQAEAAHASDLTAVEQPGAASSPESVSAVQSDVEDEASEPDTKWPDIFGARPAGFELAQTIDAAVEPRPRLRILPADREHHVPCLPHLQLIGSTLDALSLFDAYDRPEYRLRDPSAVPYGSEVLFGQVRPCQA